VPVQAAIVLGVRIGSVVPPAAAVALPAATWLRALMWLPACMWLPVCMLHRDPMFGGLGFASEFGSYDKAKGRRPKPTPIHFMRARLPS
jgi:hypothetical protein